MNDNHSDEVLSIKKRTAHDIFYGEDANTGQMLHISAVASGLKCNCICPLCKRPLEAKKGDIQAHHFAHQSNYDCFYSSEVAVYKVVAEILSESKRIMLPGAVLSFPAWRGEVESLQKKGLFPLDDAPSYRCEEKQYPPDLIATVRGKHLRIILDFGGYYDKHDISELRETERARNHACIRYSFPECGNDDFFSKEHLKSVLEHGTGAAWVYNPLESQWRKQYREKARRLRPVDGLIDCPLHKRKVGNRYCVPLSTCLECKFNVSESNSCLCLGGQGYEHKRDFEADETARLEKVRRMRTENDKRIEEEMRIREEQELQRKRREAEAEKRRQQERDEADRQRRMRQEALERARREYQAERETEYQRICASFDEHSGVAAIDKYGRRWIKCRICGEIKQSGEMAEYGGAGRTNTGTCSLCARKLT